MSSWVQPAAAPALAPPRLVDSSDRVRTESRRLLSIAPAAALLPAAIAAALVAFFDVRSATLLQNDSPGYFWSLQHLNPLHIHLYPNASALALPQLFWAKALTLGHSDPTLARLSELPFVVLASWCTYRLARRIGARTGWAALAALTLLLNPLFLANSATFMSDVPYLGLQTAALLLAARWVEKDQMAVACAIAVFLAAMQRQIGCVLPLGITVAVISARGSILGRSDWLKLGLLWSMAVLALLSPFLFHFAPPTSANRFHAAIATPLDDRLPALAYTPVMLGAGILPFFGALWFRPRSELQGRLQRLIVILIAVALAGVVLELLSLGMNLLPGNVFTYQGLGPATLGNYSTKVALLPAWAIGVMVGLAVVAMARVLSWGFPAVRSQLNSPLRVMLVAVSASQIGPLLLLDHTPFDRYYLPATAALIPVVALYAQSTSRPRLAIAVASALLGAWVALFGVGEQDYLAWQGASAQAASYAYSLGGAVEIDGGYENNKMREEIPYYEATGKMLASLSRTGAWDFGTQGPLKPLVMIEYGTADGMPLARDPVVQDRFEPVATFYYRSVVSGSVIVAVRRTKVPAAGLLRAPIEGGLYGYVP